MARPFSAVRSGRWRGHDDGWLFEHGSRITGARRADAGDADGLCEPYPGLWPGALRGRRGGGGVDGFIVPDLPPEEADELEALANEAGLVLVHFLAPTSNARRVANVTGRAQGFIYLVSLTG